MSGRRLISLQLKAAAAILLIVLTPLVVSAFLVDFLAKSAGNFAQNEAQAQLVPMGKAFKVYDALFEITKQLHVEIAQRIAARPEIATPTTGGLETLLAQEPGLHEIAVLDAGRTTLADATSPTPIREGWTLRRLEYPLAGGGALRLAFTVPNIQPEKQDLKDAIVRAEKVGSAVRGALPDAHRNAFLYTLSGAALLAGLLGVFAARRLTRRIEALVAAARQVSAGRRDARVELYGRDEMAELGVAFNTMLDDLEKSRQQVEYLQRIGAWQEVARRLAHEIKNPLTPIQLAVQQAVSQYQGDDARFRALLGETREIVEEEIAGLRRLVDTFRTLGQLPRVDPVPLAIREVIEDLERDPAFGPRLRLEPPKTAARVRGDKLLLKRVLCNLVENGIQAGQEAGHAGDVVIGWGTTARGTVAITVDDHGKGVAAAERDRIFEPYVTTKSAGTGLGLAIAKKIALEHGGDLSIAAEPAPTGGARFVLTLPAAQ